MSIYAVVVTFHPNRERLASLLATLRPQVDDVLVIDNTDRNIGIAAAQNVGIRQAIDRGAKYVVLFDQDSIPATDMISVLKSELLALPGKVAAIGPNYRHGDGFKASGRTPQKVDLLISSGCLMPVEAIRDVGFMNEALFIDLVDTEWLLRAQQKGWAIYQSTKAMMEHSLGDGSIRVWFGKWHHVPKHSPLRHYYYIRNSVYLYAHSNLPLRWKISSAKRLIIRAIAFWRHMPHMLAGVMDGLLGRMGPHRLTRSGT